MSYETIRLTVGSNLSLSGFPSRSPLRAPRLALRLSALLDWTLLSYVTPWWRMRRAARLTGISPAGRTATIVPSVFERSQRAPQVRASPQPIAGPTDVRHTYIRHKLII